MNRKRSTVLTTDVERSWWKPWTWLRRAPSTRITRSAQQLEMILGSVKPVRNPLVDDDVTLVKRRSDTRVLHETQLPTTARHAVERESDRAWKRLRDRKVTDLRVEV